MDMDPGNEGGPNLTSSWESNAGAITLEAGGLSLVIAGPTHIGNVSADSEEPYSWNPPTSTREDIGAFLADYVLLNTAQQDATTLTLDDGVNIAPTVTIDTGPTTIDAGATLSLNATVSDPGDTYDVLWTGSGTFTPATSEDPSWVAPSPTAQTTYTLTLTATDSGGLEGSDTVDITVRRLDTTPVLPAVADQSGFVGIAYSFTFPTATSGEGPLSYSITGNLPSGLSFNTNSRVLSGTPTTVQTRSLTYRVEDADGDTDSDAFTFTVANPLLLADSDDTGLEVDAKALLVASADGTAGNFIYEDADRGGTDTPLDGELGLGAAETVISGIRRRTATLLQLNDDNNPVALDIGAYFSTGGAGADLTIYLQTLAGGEVSFPATASFSRIDQVRFALPAAAQTLLENLADGDRFIFKTARPAAGPTAHAVDAGNIEWAFDVPEPSVTHTSAAGTDHAVNAGDVHWAFAIPQPTVTHTVASGAHAVDAGDVAWAFHLPQPTVTKRGRSVIAYDAILHLRYWGEQAPATFLLSPEAAGITQDLGFGAAWDSHTRAVPAGLWNHIWRNITALLVAAVRRGGALDWNGLRDYEAAALVVHAANLYRASQPSGPATSNATAPDTPNNSVWAVFGSGEVVNATTSVKGVMEQATPTELNAGDSSGSVAALFVNPATLSGRKASGAQARTGSSSSRFLTAANVAGLRADATQAQDSTDDERYVPVSVMSEFVAAAIDDLFSGTLVAPSVLDNLFDGVLLPAAQITTRLDTAFADAFDNHYQTPELGPATGVDRETLATATLPTNTAAALTSRADIGTWTAVDADVSISGSQVVLAYPRGRTPHLAVAVLANDLGVLAERVIPYGMVTQDVRLRFAGGRLDPRQFHASANGTLRFALRAGSNSLPAGATLRLSALGIYDA